MSFSFSTFSTPSSNRPEEERRNKAELLLGLDDNQNRNPNINVQHNGFLNIRETSSAGPLAVWRKRFCVVKDGFFLWYNTTCYTSFDRKPKGIFPLNGAYVGMCESDSQKTTIELIHPDILRASFLLKAPNSTEAFDWLTSLENAKKATWENAQLGFAMLEKMKAQGTKLEAEKNAAVEALEAKISKLNKANEAKLQVVEKERKQMEKFQEQLEAEAQALAEKNEEVVAIEEAVKKEEEVFREAEEKRKALEGKLNMANLALRRLEEALNIYFGFDSDPGNNATANADLYQKARLRASAGRGHGSSGIIDRKTSNISGRSGQSGYSGASGANSRKTSRVNSSVVRKYQSARTSSLNKGGPHMNGLEPVTRTSSTVSSFGSPPPMPPLPPQEQSVRRNVAALRSFFEETFRVHKNKQEKVVGKKLKVIQETLRRSTRNTFGDDEY